MLARLRSLLSALTGRGRFEHGMSDELRFHIDACERDLIRSGSTPEEARRRAAIAFGTMERVKQECREQRGLRLPDEFARNLRYAARTLAHSPGFTASATLTLALCIGANTAMFSVIDAALLRPLPYREPDKLAEAVTVISKGGAEVEKDNSQDGAAWEMLHAHASKATYAASSGGWTGVNIAANGQAQYVSQNRVTAGYFDVLGTAPALGREFSAEEDREGGPAAVILSHGLWMRLFNGAPTAIGSPVLLAGEPHIVVGVMPERLRPMFKADLWTPLRPTTHGEGSGNNFMVLARVRPGATLTQAGAEFQALGERLNEGLHIPAGITVRRTLEPVQSVMSFGIGKLLYLLWAAVGIVLLIGCLNVAGLLIVRSNGRTREMAIRMALGGGKGPVVRQLLTESLVIAMLGGAAGAAVGYAGIRALSGFADQALGVWQELRLDGRVLLATSAVAILTSVLFGLLPAFRAARTDIRAGLTEGGGRGVAGGSSRWPRRLLVAGEIAMSMVLLVGAGLLIRTFQHLRNLTPGFDGAGVLAASLSLQDARYATTAAGNRLFNETLDRIRELPGVESAAVGLHVPYERWLNNGFRWPASDGADGKSTIVSMSYVTPGYFRTLRIPMIAGRDFDGHDTAGAPGAAIVNQEFARRYMDGRTPMGATVITGKERRTIVGVVGDIQQRPSWGNAGPLAPMPTMYVPAAQMEDGFFRLIHTWFAPKWVVRASGVRQQLVEGMRRAVEQSDPSLPFAAFQALDEVRDETLLSQRVQTGILGALAALALTLATVGVYGLVANSVAQRAREIGIRMALGSTAARAAATVVVPVVALAAISTVAGSAIAAACSRILSGSVHGVGTLDPATYAAVGALLLAVSAAACVLPALRIARISAADTLRDE